MSKSGVCSRVRLPAVAIRKERWPVTMPGASSVLIPEFPCLFGAWTSANLSPASKLSSNRTLSKGLGQSEFAFVPSAYYKRSAIDSCDRSSSKTKTVRLQFGANTLSALSAVNIGHALTLQRNNRTRDYEDCCGGSVCSGCAEYDAIPNLSG